MVSLVTFSTMVSSMTSMMGTWYAEKEPWQYDFSEINGYIEEHNCQIR